jgi:hypothetical protein
VLALKAKLEASKAKLEASISSEIKIDYFFKLMLSRGETE